MKKFNSVKEIGKKVFAMALCVSMVLGAVPGRAMAEGEAEEAVTESVVAEFVPVEEAPAEAAPVEAEPVEAVPAEEETTEPMDAEPAEAVTEETEPAEAAPAEEETAEAEAIPDEETEEETVPAEDGYFWDSMTDAELEAYILDPDHADVLKDIMADEEAFDALLARIETMEARDALLDYLASLMMRTDTIEETFDAPEDFAYASFPRTFTEMYFGYKPTFKLDNITLSGNPLADFLTIAKNQVGRNRSQMGYNCAYCDKFVLDCARLAGIPTSAIPNQGGCSYLYNAVLNAGGYVTSEKVAGDLVFYYCKTCKIYPHVGICAGGDMTLEGNVGGNVVSSNRASLYYVGTCGHTSKDVIKRIYVHPNYPGSYKPAAAKTVYNVKYNANGGTGSMADAVVTYGVSVPLRTNTFTRDGYTFAGWYAKRQSDGKIFYTNGTENRWYVPGQEPSGYSYYIYANGQNISKTSDVNNDVVTFYATWKGVPFTVIYDANGGSGSMADTKVTYGTVTPIRTNTFVRPGYAFKGWYVQCTTTGKVIYKNGTETHWFTPGQEPAGYGYDVYPDGAKISKTTNLNNNVLIFHAIWEKIGCGLDHSWDASVETAPTAIDSGALALRCTACGEERFFPLPVLNENDYTREGDNLTFNITVFGIFTFPAPQTLAITAQPQSVSANSGATVSFTVAAKGSGLHYQWQFKTPAGTSWNKSPATGCTTDTLLIPATIGRSGYSYRCVITDANGNQIISDAAVLSVTSLTVKTQPKSVTAAIGSNVTFTVAANGSGLRYQWQFKTATGSWCKSPAEGCTTDTLVIPATSGRNGYSYRCVITDANGAQVISNPAVLTVSTLAVRSQPKSVTAKAGTTASFTVAANGDGLRYQWQFKTPTGSWCKSPAEGSTTATLLIPATTGRNGYQYRCIITDSLGLQLTTTPASLTVVK